MKFSCVNRKMICETDIHVIGDCSDHLIEIALDSEWTNKVVTVRFQKKVGNLSIDTFLVDGSCFIPMEIMKSGWILVGIYCDEFSSTASEFYIHPSIRDKITYPIQPTPDIYIQILELIQNMSGGGSAYILPTMSNVNKGGAKAGNNLEVIDEILHVVGVITEETDPSVPSWAKQATKPIYTKSEVGLGNVDNTSDTNKPISTAMQTALNGKVNTSSVGSSNGVAQLDENGRVPASQIPGSVDEVIEGFLYVGVFYKDITHLQPVTGESGKIYSDLYSDKLFRWSGSLYAEISASLALGENSSTAYAGDKGKKIRDDLNAHMGSGGTAHALATTTEAGFIAPEEKTKLQSIAENANNYSLTNDLLSAVLSGTTEEVIVDADTVPFTDVSGANGTKKITWANIKATLKSYFDGLYMAVTGGDIVADAVSLSFELVKYPRVKKTAILNTCTSLTVTLPGGYNWFDEFVLYFTTGATPPTPVWPVSDSNWIGGKPTLEANKTYVISFQNGIGVAGSV